MLEISHDASYVKNPDLENSKAYFLVIASKVLDLPVNITTEVETIVRSEYNYVRNNRCINIDIEDLTVAAIMFVYAHNGMVLDEKKIEEFMRLIFTNEKGYQASKTSIRRLHKKISENYKTNYITGLKVSDKAVKIMGML